MSRPTWKAIEAALGAAFMEGYTFYDLNSLSTDEDAERRSYTYAAEQVRELKAHRSPEGTERAP